MAKGESGPSSGQPTEPEQPGKNWQELEDEAVRKAAEAAGEEGIEELALEKILQDAAEVARGEKRIVYIPSEIDLGNVSFVVNRLLEQGVLERMEGGGKIKIKSQPKD